MTGSLLYAKRAYPFTGELLSTKLGIKKWIFIYSPVLIPRCVRNSVLNNNASSARFSLMLSIVNSRGILTPLNIFSLLPSNNFRRNLLLLISLMRKMRCLRSFCVFIYCKICCLVSPRERKILDKKIILRFYMHTTFTNFEKMQTLFSICVNLDKRKFITIGSKTLLNVLFLISLL